MPTGVNGYRCMACGRQDMCGDCIPQYCDACESKIVECHGGQMPVFFSGNGGEAHDDCPCSDCRMAWNDKEIRRKLALEGKGE